jgi:hypothetical protein
MARKKPNIDFTTTTVVKDRKEFKDFVLSVVKDTFIYQFVPNELGLDETGKLFTLYLYNKRLIIDALELDNYSDYIDIYLYGVKQPQDRYTVTLDDPNIVIQFNVDITRLPQDVIATDFLIKGKIVEIE